MTSLSLRLPALMLGRLAILTILAGTAGDALAASQEQSGGDGSDYRLTMTWVSGGHRFATIDGELYTLGDELPGGARLVAIEPRLVRVSGSEGVRAIHIESRSRAQSPGHEGNRRTLDTYLDNVVAELDRAGQRGSDPAGLESLKLLRDRLNAARNRLAGGDLTTEEKRQLEAELNEDWILAQEQLDALRGRLLLSGQGMGLEELRATQRILEETMLAALSRSLTALQDPDAEPPSGQPADLLQAIRSLLTTYPDYQALADKLEQRQADQQ